MKLLIVEDEKMAREGLLNSLDWPKVGINKVFSAENGEVGLFMAKRIMPDIVLTDIRMPRMDGITMAGRIRELFPECRIIFLSAYSEIDYYKAAIGLKAVRYMDKPIESEELHSVMLEAVAECKQVLRYKNGQDLHHIHDKQKLADTICMGEDTELIEKEIRRLKLRSFSKSNALYITAFIICLRLNYEDEALEDHMELATLLSAVAGHTNIYTIRHKSRIVLYMFTPSKLSNYNIGSVCKKFQSVLGSRVYSLVVGCAAKGAANANKTYVSAKAALEKAYCFPWRESVIYSDDLEKNLSVSAYTAEKNRILDAFNENRDDEVFTACESLYKNLKERKDLVHNKARELYFEIISEVFRKADSMHLQIKEDDDWETISWVVRIENYNLEELHSFLLRQLSLLFAAMEETKNDKKQILAIKDYISQNYSNDALSISDISVFLHMSASHVCTMFKKETGDTINNYLTEYRLKKARQYLSETLFSISEISAKVGYKDNSYFGRIFRRHVGMTPNEYRNR